MPQVSTRNDRKKNDADADEEDATNAIILKELRNLKRTFKEDVNHLKSSISNLEDFTNERLDGIEKKLSELGSQVANFEFSLKQVDSEVTNLKESLLYTQSNVEDMDNKLIEQVKKLEKVEEEHDRMQQKLYDLERYSRSFNVRIIGVGEENGRSDDGMQKTIEMLEKLGFENPGAEVENAHRTGKYVPGRARHIIAKFYSRPFKHSVLRTFKQTRRGNEEPRIVEDLIQSDFELRKKALPKMKEAYDRGSKVSFRRGRLLIDGKFTDILVIPNWQLLVEQHLQIQC